MKYLFPFYAIFAYGCMAEHSDEMMNLEMKINQLTLKVQSLQERMSDLEADKMLKKSSPKVKR